MNTISACLIVRDEASLLPRCLTSLREQVDEVVVVDTGSTDETQEIALRHGALVIHEDWRDDFSHARNVSIAHASSDWILIIDADEYVDASFRQTTHQCIEAHGTPFLGKVRIQSALPHATPGMPSSQWVTSHITRLLPRIESVRYRGCIHEQVVDASASLPWHHTGITIMHSGYALTDDTMRRKTLRNLTLLRSALTKEPDNGYLWFQMGKSLVAIGDGADALQALQNSLCRTAPEQAYHAELCMTYLYAAKHAGDADAVWPVLLDTLRRYPDFPDVHFFMAGAYMAFGIPDLTRIAACYETCLAIGERGDIYPSVHGVGSYLALYNLGAYHEALGDRDAARSYYEAAAEYGYAPATTACERLA